MDDLIINLGLSKEFILKSLKEINAQKGVFYMFDSEHNKIVDSKLMEEVSISKKCANCGNTISASVSIHALKPINCSYCGASTETHDIQKLREERVVEIETKVEQAALTNFNPLTFGILMFVFWPAGIYYYISKKNS